MRAGAEYDGSPVSDRQSSFAYLFERFPSFVQTFVYREAVEMVRQGMEPWLVSIRQPDDPGELAEHLDVDVFYAPEEKALRSAVDAARDQGKLSGRARKAIPQHRGEKDSQRMFEAIWLAPQLRARGVRHVHAHFGGMAARTAWWLQKLFGFTYSFTGHANDIFCATDFPVSNEALVRGAKFVVTETDFARLWMEKRYPHAKGKVFRVFNGIAMDDFPPRTPAGPVPKIVSVGRYVEKKGFPDLITACALLHQGGLEFQCEIIGGGPLAAALETQIRKLSLGNYVQLTGPFSQTEVRQRLAASQVFALACAPDSTGGRDNLPTVIMEAMALGLPVVSTRLAGVPEMISEGHEGLLAAPRDPPAFATALETLLRSPALAAKCGVQARATAVERFSVEKTTAVLKHLLVSQVGVLPPPAALAQDSTLLTPSWLARLRQRFG